MRRPSLTAILRDILADGAPHTLGAMLAACRPAIRPEVAIRRFRNAHIRRVHMLSLDDSIERGELLLIRQALMALGAKRTPDSPRSGVHSEYYATPDILGWRQCSECNRDFRASSPQEKYCSMRCLRQHNSVAQAARRARRTP
jgi:hypothetical protein